jgi:peptide/nickel transport system permease protein
MGDFLIKRGLFGLLTIFAVSMFTYIMLVIVPGGDPARRFAGKSPTPELIHTINVQYGFDKPFPMNYLKMMEQIVTGQIVSRNTGANVVQQALHAIPVTASLAVVAMVMWLAVGVSFGIVGATRPGTMWDRGLMIASRVGISMPAAWLALIMLKKFTIDVPIFPPGDYQTIQQGGIFGWLYHLVLPAATLAVLSAGVYARMTRSSVRQSLREEYIKTATAKGLPKNHVFVHHVLRTALIPIIVMLGLDFGALLGGAIFTESVFGLPGLGSVLMVGIQTLDPAIILPCTIIAGVFVIAANIAVDIAQAMIDPRVRLG